MPTVVLATDEFEALARLESQNRGVPGLPLVVVPHPLGGISAEEVLGKVDAAVPAVLRGVAPGG